MASVTKNDQKKTAADDAESASADDRAPAEETAVERTTSAAVPASEYKPQAAPASRGPSFFTIYKKGQGYWTRIGTVAGASLLALLTAQFLYTRGRTWFTNANGRANMPVVMGMVVGFLVVFAVIVWRIINKPTVVDFLIATDSEMKKVNWTTRAELIGSTKVVIFFMILIGILLFFFDTVFGYFFYLVKVLQFGPFG
jgi:preprotein translocase SecE subunit